MSAAATTAVAFVRVSRRRFAEAMPSGSDIVYPVKDSSGLPVNWKMLSINKFTGRVEYYPLPE